MKKKIYMSKTMWFNFILLALAMFDKEFFQTMGVPDILLPKIEIILVKLCAVGNLFLRYYSSQDEIEKPKGSNNEGIALIAGFILAL